MNNHVNENNYDGNHRINSSKITTSKFFEYKTKIIGSAPVDNGRLDEKTVVPLKYLSNF